MCGQRTLLSFPAIPDPAPRPYPVITVDLRPARAVAVPGCRSRLPFPVPVTRRPYPLPRALLRRFDVSLTAGSCTRGDRLDEGDETLALERQREVGEGQALQRRGEWKRDIVGAVVEHDRSTWREADTLEPDVARRLQRGGSIEDDDEWRIARRQRAGIVQTICECHAVPSSGQRLSKALEQRVIRSDQQSPGHAAPAQGVRFVVGGLWFVNRSSGLVTRRRQGPSIGSLTANHKPPSTVVRIIS